MITPLQLKPGDKIGIAATARKINEHEIEEAVQIFQNWKLEVVLSPYLYSKDHSYLAGTDQQRIAAVQQFLDDDSIRAIICARGGYGTTRIIENLNFGAFKKYPKWVVGFSDITAIHLKLHNLGYKSIHATMPILFSRSDSGSSIESLRKALFGDPLQMLAPSHEMNKNGKANGMLIGGNLSLVVDALGTAYEPETTGKILVLEEVDEYLYKVDRMIVQLKRAGKLDHLAGLVVGHFSEMKDTELSFGESIQEIIRFHTNDFQYPVGFNFPTGHVNPNLAWVQGQDALLTVEDSGSSLLHSR